MANWGFHSMDIQREDEVASAQIVRGNNVAIIQRRFLAIRPIQPDVYDVDPTSTLHRRASALRICRDQSAIVVQHIIATRDRIA